MGAALLRGVIAYLALYLTVILSGILATFWFPDPVTCPDGRCTFGEKLSQVPALAIVIAYTFAFVSVLIFLPFLVLFLILTYLKTMNIALWAVLGMLTAIWLGLSQRAFGDGVDQGGGWGELASLFASPAGLAILLAGAACGLSVWATDRSLKGKSHG